MAVGGVAEEEADCATKGLDERPNVFQLCGELRLTPARAHIYLRCDIEAIRCNWLVNIAWRMIDQDPSS